MKFFALAIAFLIASTAYAQSVSPPVVTPAPGPFTGTLTIAITDAQPNARIYYTTDGTQPTSASHRYVAPFVISTTVTLKVIAMYSMPNSPTVSGVYTLSAGNNCLPASTTWVDSPFTSQTGSFQIAFDATPAVAKMDGVMGLSLGAATDYTSMGPIVRFNPTGNIDAINGAAFYTAASTIPYTAGTAYHFVLTVNVSAHTYSATVNGTTIGSNYAFRTDQANVASLNNINSFADVGKDAVCNVAVSASVPPPHSVTLNWNETPPQPTYNVYRSSVSGGPYSKISSAIITSYTDPSVVVGQKYFYVVTAVNSTGLESKNSSEVNAVIP